jgi:selT/selW/selH-like putative selenoprotein
LAAAIKKACDAQPKLIEGHGGVFDVRVDGELIYSKHSTGRFPDEAEILTQLASRR